MAALAGAAGGAAAGGLTAALIGMGIPEYEAKRYEGKVKDGNVLMSVHTEDSTERDRAKKSSRSVEQKIFPTLVRPLFLKIKEQPKSVIKVVRVEVGTYPTHLQLFRD